MCTNAPAAGLLSLVENVPSIQRLVAVFAASLNASSCESKSSPMHASPPKPVAVPPTLVAVMIPVRSLPKSSILLRSTDNEKRSPHRCWYHLEVISRRRAIECSLASWSE